MWSWVPVSGCSTGSKKPRARCCSTVSAYRAHDTRATGTPSGHKVASTRFRPERRVAGPRGITQRLLQRTPLAVGLDRDRDPRVPPAGVVDLTRQVQVLRSADAAVARALQQAPVRLVLEHLLGRHVQ